MSMLTATPLRSAPSAAAAPTVADAASVWANTAWVELIASTSGVTALAGITLYVVSGGSFSGLDLEVDVGVGGVGAEVRAATIRLRMENSGTGTYKAFLLPIPVGGIAAASRIAFRIRNSAAVARVWSCGLLYYHDLASDQQTTEPLLCVPAAATGVTLTPNASAWTNSSWVEVTAGLASPIHVVGVVMKAAWAVDYELDIGTGGAGSETVITTLRDTFFIASAGRQNWHLLPGPFPLATSTRIAVRLRKAGTSVTTAPVTLLYYTRVADLDVAGATLSSASALSAPTVRDYESVTGAFRSSAAALTAPTVTPGAVTNLGATIASGAVLRPPVVNRDVVLLANTITATISAGAVLRAPRRVYDPAAPTHLALDPDIWCELRLAQFPADLETLVYRFAFTPLADTTYKEGRLISVGPCSRTMSDIDGNFTPGKTIIVLDDSDGALRSLLAQDTGTEYFVNREAVIYLLSAAGRAAGLTPRSLFRGWISDVQALKGRRVQIEITDVVAAQFSGFNLDKTFPSVTLQDLSPITPDALKNQVLPIYVGEHSDKGARGPGEPDPHHDTNGLSAEKGLVPVFDLGDWPLDGSSSVSTVLRAPTNLVATRIGDVPPVKTLATVVAELQASVTALTTAADWGSIIGFADADALEALGTVPDTYVALAQVIGYGDLEALLGGSSQYTYAVSAITATGETRICEPVTVVGPRVLDSAHCIRLTWTHADAAAEAATVAFRICGRAYKPEDELPTTWLTALNNRGTWVDPETTYDDDGRDAEKPAPGGAFHTANADPNMWGLMAICLGYGYDLIDIFASNLSQYHEPKRIALPSSAHGTEVVTWTDPHWPHPDPWIEMNGIRFTGFYLRGHRLAAHRDGTVTVAVNLCGPHDTASPPRLIDQAYRQLLFVLNEHVAKNHGTGYRAGAYWPLETYDNGDALFQTSQFEACQATTVGWVGGLGHLGAIAITEPTTVREFLRRFCRTFGCHLTTNHHGQVFPLLIDPGVLPTSGRALREHIEILDINDAVLAHTEVLNRIVAQFHWDSDGQKFRVENQLTEDLVSIAAHAPGAVVGSLDRRGLRKEEREQHYTNDATTAADVTAKVLARRFRRPRYVTVTVNLMGLDYDIGSVVFLTHSDGLGVDGDVAVPMLVIEQTVDATPPASVTLRLQDLRTMIQRLEIE